MVETGNQKKQAFGWANGFNQALAVFGWAVLIAISGNIGLAPLLIAIGLATIAKLVLGGHRYPLWATPSFIFLPALFIFSRGLTTLPIGSPAWNFRMGGLFVTLWISGLAYILIATIVRYVGLQKMRRAFSPIFSGIIIVLLSLSLLPRIFQYAYYEPLISGIPSYKLLIIGLAAFIGYLITTSLAKKPGAQAKFAVLIGLGSGLAATVLVDAVEVLFLSKDLASTLLIGRFDATLFQGVPLTVFHNLETSFGFFQYLHFDLESALLFIPLVLVAVAEHIHSFTKYVVMSTDGDINPQADKTIIGEGVSILVGGMISGYPLTIDESVAIIATTGKKAKPFVVIVISLLLVIIGVFVPISHLFTIIPPAVIGGVLLAWAGYNAMSGFSRVAHLVHGALHPLGTSLSLLVLGLGMILVMMEFISDFIGNDSLRIMIGTTPFPSYLIIILLAFIVNMAFPRLVE